MPRNNAMPRAQQQLVLISGIVIHLRDINQLNRLVEVGNAPVIASSDILIRNEMAAQSYAVSYPRDISFRTVQRHKNKMDLIISSVASVYQSEARMTRKASSLPRMIPAGRSSRQ